MEAAEAVAEAVATHKQSLKDTTGSGLARSFRVSHVSSPFYSGEGKVETSLDDERLVCLFDENVKTVLIETGDALETLQEDDDPKKEVIVCFALHPGGEELVTCSQNGLLRHWRGKECLRAIKAHQMPVLSMAYDPTGTLVATGSADRSVRVWDVARGYCTHSFRDHTDIVTLLKFHPNPMTMTLVSGGQDNTIRLYDLVDQKCTSVFREHMSQPTSVGWAPDEYLFVTGGRDKTINFYELRDRKLLKTVAIMDEVEGAVFLNSKHASALLGLAGGKGKNRSAQSTGEPRTSSVHVLVLGGEKGLVRIFMVALEGKSVASFSCTPLATFGVHELGLTDIAGSGGGDGGSVTGGKSESAPHSINSIHYLETKNELLLSTKDAHFFSFRLKGGSILAKRQFVGSHDDVLDISCLPEYRGSLQQGAEVDSAAAPARLAVATNSAVVRLMSCGSSECQLLHGHTDIVLALDSSLDGRWLATSSKDTTIRVWDLHAAKGPSCLVVGRGHTDAVGTIAISQRLAGYSAKQAFAVSAAGDKIIKKWNFFASLKAGAGSKDKEADGASSIMSALSIRAHDKDINTVAISPNDSLVASGSQDKSIRLWRSEDLAPVATLSGHKRGVWKVAFSPIDRALCSSSGDKTLRLWSMADYSCLRTFEGHTASVLCCRFISQGMQIISGSADGLVRLWDVRTGECINTFDKHEDKIWAISVPRPTEVPQAAVDGGNEDDGEALSASATADPTAMQFYSGGSDARILTWVDSTKEEEDKRLEETERYLLQEQQLMNDIRNKRFGKALTAALELGHSNRVLRILNSVLVEAPEGSDATAQHDMDNEPVTPSQQGRKLDRYVSKFNDDECTKLVSFCKEWNTNSRNAHLSQLALSSLLRTLGVERLLSIKQVANAVPALLAYSERHFQRIDRLHQAAYALEYISGLMSLLPVAESTADKNGGSSKGVVKRKRAQLIIFGDQHTANANANANDSDSDSGSDEPQRVESASKKSKEGKGGKAEKARPKR